MTSERRRRRAAIRQALVAGVVVALAGLVGYVLGGAENVGPVEQAP